MPLIDILMVPWRSANRALRWLSLAIVIACALCAAAIGLHMRFSDRWWLGSCLIYCVGAGYAWAFWLSTSLLLAIDARKLRLPGMQRAVHASVLLYGSLMIGLPTLVIGAPSAHAWQVLLLATLAVTGGLAFVLLPRWCAMVVGFLPALGTSARYFFQLPSLSDPRWLDWGALALAVLVIVDVLRWRQLLHGDTDNELGFGSAMVLQFRRQGTLNNWNGLQQLDSGQMIRQRPDWMQPRADLRRTGPQSTVRSLRVALGGWYMPKTMAGHLRASAPVLLPVLLMVPVMALMFAGNHRADAPNIALIGFGAGLVWCVLFGGLMLAAMATVLIRQRWQRTNAELPLLALLPGLGDGQYLRHSLLRAALTIPLLTQLLLSAILLIAALAAARFMHLDRLTLLLIALPQFAAAGTMVVQVLCTLGGRKLPTWIEWLVYVPLFVLFFLSIFVPATAMGKHPWQGADLTQSLLLAAWAVMAMVLAWIGRRGWQGLLARPHPFMSN
ncbi:hypothetical protein [Rhodanobacter hydrolyticus]|uniref:ABC transporter permease n=1 Tax=Rhodanobacter hydrolyticus TaxID=2250595 RepID=A0ABW8J5K3_9GAMM